MFEFKDVTTPRRGFLGTMAAAAAAGLASLTPLRLEAKERTGASGADAAFEAWLNKITGKHKMVFDAPEVNDGFGVIWPRIWLNGNNDNYGTKDAENSGVVILRHASIPLAMKDELWTKYPLGDFFSIKEGTTPATRNIFAKVMPLPLPGTGVEALLASGVQIGVCNVALTVYSAMLGQKIGKDGAAIKADWVAGLIPGVQIVPSGVLAVSRAQEKGCGYCFAG